MPTLLVHMSVPSERQVSLHTLSWQHRNPKPHIQEEPSYVAFEFSNHHCRLPQQGSSMKLHVVTIKFSLEPTTFSFALCRKGSLQTASDRLGAIFFPVTNDTASIARRHLLQFIDGFSCAPCAASTFV